MPFTFVFRSVKMIRKHLWKHYEFCRFLDEKRLFISARSLSTNKTATLEWLFKVHPRAMMLQDLETNLRRALAFTIVDQGELE